MFNNKKEFIQYMSASFILGLVIGAFLTLNFSNELGLMSSTNVLAFRAIYEPKSINEADSISIESDIKVKSHLRVPAQE